MGVGRPVGDRWEGEVFPSCGGGKAKGLPLSLWNWWLFSAEESRPRWGSPQESLSLRASEPEGQVWLLLTQTLTTVTQAQRLLLRPWAECAGHRYDLHSPKIVFSASESEVGKEGPRSVSHSLAAGFLHGTRRITRSLLLPLASVLPARAQLPSRDRNLFWTIYAPDTVLDTGVQQ